MDTPLATNERLVVSDNGGRTWKVATNQIATNNSWETQLPGDGRYWVSIRAVDEQGRLGPVDDTAPPRLVVVDSTLPRLKLELTEIDDGTIVGKILAADPNLASASLRHSAWIESPTGERIPCEPKEVRHSPGEGVIAEQIVWSPKTPGRFVLNASVKDNAQNEVAQSNTLDIADAADRRAANVKSAEPASLRLNAPELSPEPKTENTPSDARRLNLRAVLANCRVASRA